MKKPKRIESTQHRATPKQTYPKQTNQATQSTHHRTHTSPTPSQNATNPHANTHHNTAQDTNRHCDFIGICGGCDEYENYTHAKAPKSNQPPNSCQAPQSLQTLQSPHIQALIHKAKQLGSTLSLNTLSIYASPESSYRARGEFRVFKEYQNTLESNSKSNKIDSSKPNLTKRDSSKPESSLESNLLDSASQAHISKLSLSMSAKGQNSRILIPNCPILLPSLQALLDELLPLLQADMLFSHKLYAIEVLGSRFATQKALQPTHKDSITLESNIIESNTIECSVLESNLLDSNPLESNLLESSSLARRHTARPLRITLHTIQPDTTHYGDIVLSLIYHKTLDEHFIAQAKILLKALQDKLARHTRYAIRHISIIARSKNAKHIITLDTSPNFLESIHTDSRVLDAYVPESSLYNSQLARYDTISDCMLINKKPYYYVRQEGQFCQPNAYMNPQMISFVKSHIQAHSRDDLLEMYGGDGNFSIALAECFNKVFVTEVVKTASALIRHNAYLNGIHNLTSVRLSGAETMSAFSGERAFFRLKGIDINSFCFSHILIDPPRSGIGDTKMLRFIARFPHIIYISCNPTSLQADLKILLTSHDIEHFGLFDQFPHTPHKECILLLKPKGALVES